MIEDYLTKDKTFYDLISYKWPKDSTLKQKQNNGIFEIHQSFFQVSESPINVSDSLGFLFVSETIFEDCSGYISGISISCPNHEFDISISKCCVYKCGNNVKTFSEMTCSADSIVQFKDFSITLCQYAISSGTEFLSGFCNAELIGHNESHIITKRHSGPYLTSQYNRIQFFTDTDSETSDGIFVFMSIGDSFASHLVITNNTVTAALDYACVFTNTMLYIKESYIINNPVSLSINARLTGTLRALNCVCDSPPSSGIITTSFPEPQLRHLSLGKCLAKNPLLECQNTQRLLDVTKSLVNVIFLFAIEGVN